MFNTDSHFQTKTPCHFVTRSRKITSHAVHFQLQKQKISVYFAARGITLLWLFFHLNCSGSVVYLALPTYNTEFVALAVSTMYLVEWEFLLCE